MKTPPPKKRSKPSDKFELSPTSRAKCRTCKRNISEGQGRYGISTFSARCNDYIFHYYHQKCLPSTVKPRMKSSPHEQIAQQRQTEVLHERLLVQRQGLRKKLQQLRMVFSKRLGRSPFIIFDDKTLDDIVVKLPENRSELLQVHGFKEKRYRSFGSPVLLVVHQYLQEHNMNQRRDKPDKKPAAASSSASGARRRLSATVVIDDSDDETPVQMAQSLTCEEIVNNKFAEAKANGYLISVDV